MYDIYILLVIQMSDKQLSRIHVRCHSNLQMKFTVNMEYIKDNAPE